MADRSIAVTLRANVTDFKKEINSAAGSLDELARRAGGTEKVAQTTLGRIAQSARLQREEWTTVGTALLTVGGALTAVGVAALKTGISYNTLQQTSRAALLSLLGSTEAVNAQMAKLDTFARTSPFAKDVFIRAQQQMLGFGIESRKVIPYLSAINDAVAATGGSNQDIAELTRIFSQVQAAAKITAVDLMQFGQRGIDAATLIGSQMGMTGAQIREAITAGTLDAGTALDALAAGMSERFEGASAAVKNTFAGALDRAKAAWRDLSAELAAPLVGPDGGGLLVSGLNKLADAMRAFESAPSWLKGGVAAIGGLGAVATTTGGAVMVALPRFLAFKESLAALSGVAPRAAAALGIFGRALGPISLAIGAVATVAAVWNARQAESVNLAKDLAATLDQQTAAVTGLTRAEVAKRLEEEGALQAAQQLGIETGQLTAAVIDGGTAMQQIAAVIAAARQETELYVDPLTGATTEMNTNAAAATTLQNVLNLLTGAFADAKAEVKRTAEETEAYEASTGAAEAASDALREAIRAQNEQMRVQQQLMNEAAGASLSLAEAKLRQEEQQWRTSEAIAAYNELVESGTASEQELLEAKHEMEVQLLNDVRSYNAVTEAMRTNGASGAELNDVIRQQREAFISTAQQMGYTAAEAEALADTYGLIPREVTTTLVAETDAASQKIQTFIDQYTGRRIAVTVDAVTGSTVSFTTGRGNRIGLAHGGLLEFYGGGGLRPMSGNVARMVPANTWRVIGDRPHGDEAFIPIDNSARSLALWEETGRRLGVLAHAAGAINTHVGALAPASNVSFDGAHITGVLEVGADGLARLVDGRIHAAGRNLVRESRARGVA